MTLFVMRPANISQAPPELATSHNASVTGAHAVATLTEEQSKMMASAAANSSVTGSSYSSSAYSVLTNDTNNNNTSSLSQSRSNQGTL